MNGVEYLKQLKHIHIIIKQLENEKRELEDKIYNIPAVDNSKVKVKSSNNRSSYSLVDKHIDDVTKIENEIIKYEKKRKKIIRYIRQLKKSEYVDVLYKRYVEFKSYDVIAIETGYSRSNVMKIHKKAIKSFEKLVLNYTKLH